MKTWKENNTLLREAAEEKRLYWRWHTDIVNQYRDKLVIAICAPRNGKLNVLLRKSNAFSNKEYATFNTKEEAEDFAARAFPGVEGEAYPTNQDLDYYEVETTFGKCLASFNIINEYKNKIDASTLDPRFVNYKPKSLASEVKKLKDQFKDQI